MRKALAEAEATRYEVPQSLAQSAINAVADMVRSRSDRPDYYSEALWCDMRAFSLLALARHGRVLESEINWLASHPLTSMEGQSHLFRTLLSTEHPKRPEVWTRLVEQLRRRVRVMATTAYLEVHEDDHYGWIFSSNVWSTAFGTFRGHAVSPSA